MSLKTNHQKTHFLGEKRKIGKLDPLDVFSTSREERGGGDPTRCLRLIGTDIKLNIPVRSDKLLLLEDFVQGSITFSSGSHES